MMENNQFSDLFSLLSSQNNTWYQGFADDIPAMIFVLDAGSKKINYVNRQFTDMLGYTREDLQTCDYDVTRFLFKDDVAAFLKELEAIGQLEDGKTHNYQSRYAVKDDGFRYFKTSSRIIKRDKEGKPHSVLFIAHDITNQLKSEEEIESLRTLMRDTEELLNYGLYEYDFVKDEYKWSDNVYNIFGVEKGTVITRQIIDSRRNYEDNLKVAAAAKKAIETLSDLDVKYEITRNGKTAYVHNKGKIVIPQKPNEKPHKIIGIVRDITASLDNQNKVQKMIAELERSNRELEEFAYVASHDLQEPLRKLLTFSQRLEAKFADVLGESGKELLNRMDNATANMQILIENLLEYSRCSTGVHPFHRILLQTLVEEVVQELDIREDANINIEIGSLPEIECIPSQIKQVFNNLITNSIKFRKQDAALLIQITATPFTEKEVQGFVADPTHRYVHIAVTDNGIGFEQEYAERVFQLFQRLHGKTEYPGAGMGLAICKKIIDRHHGYMYATSMPGKGATFHIIIPEHQ